MSLGEIIGRTLGVTWLLIIMASLSEIIDPGWTLIMFELMIVAFIFSIPVFAFIFVVKFLSQSYSALEKYNKEK